MSGFIKDEPSLANGIPAKHIGPETGSFGDAIMTRKGGTSEGTNEAYDSEPPPAAAFDSPVVTTAELGEAHAASHPFADEAPAPIDPEIESPAQQIADGGDHVRHETHDKAPHHR